MALCIFRRIGVTACLIVAAATIPSLLLAADNAPPAKAEACIACHGENGLSQLENIPSLAGQPDLFTQWQLVFFRAGTRKNEQMTPVANDLTNADIRALGAYFAALPPPGPQGDADPALMQAGAAASKQGRCASCHGDSYAGTKGTARLAGQREDYLIKALHDYKSGARSGGAMAAMASVASGLSDEAISALAHYLSRK